MTPLTPLLRAFRSELLKCRRWSMFAGTGIMLVASAFFAYLTFHQIISGATGREIDPLTHALGGQSPCRWRSEEHTSELQSRVDLVCRLLLEKKKKKNK